MIKQNIFSYCIHFLSNEIWYCETSEKKIFVGLLLSYYDILVLARNSFVCSLIYHSKFCTQFSYFWHSRHETICPQTVWRLNGTGTVNSAQAPSFRQ